MQDIVYDDAGQKTDHFVLIRSECDLDDVSVFYVGERFECSDSFDDNKSLHYIYEIGKRKDYFQSQQSTAELIEKEEKQISIKTIEYHEYPEGLYVDENGEVIDESHSNDDIKPITKVEVQYELVHTDNLITNDESGIVYK